MNALNINWTKGNGKVVTQVALIYAQLLLKMGTGKFQGP